MGFFDSEQRQQMIWEKIEAFQEALLGWADWYAVETYLSHEERRHLVAYIYALCCVDKSVQEPKISPILAQAAQTAFDEAAKELRGFVPTGTLYGQRPVFKRPHQGDPTESESRGRHPSRKR